MAKASTTEVTPLRDRYRQEVVPLLMKEFTYRNPMQVPRVQKIVVNVGMGEATSNAKLLEAAAGEIGQITGQRPMTTKARKSIAGFKLREGMSIGCKVTMRGTRMWEFLDRLLHVSLPRIRDFRGVLGRSFDGRGNYTLGLKEQLIFPEIKYDEISAIHGLDITIVTTANTDAEAKALLKHLGMPFRN
jgi:large subunit ribosomal protein L5